MSRKKGMIDVGGKRKTKREASASVTVLLPDNIVQKIQGDLMPKGNVLETARIAGIMAAKRTDEWIPLCHNLPLDSVALAFMFTKDGLVIESTVKSQGRTGVEMEALTACAAAALTVYDMGKMFSPSMTITGLCLKEKKGGQSGHYRREKKTR